MKKISYYIPGDGSAEFNPPDETHWNQMLFHHKRMEKVDSTGKLDMQGKLGHVKRYFITEKELHTLYNLFQRFHIPERLYKDLTWCFLNMVFAQTDARILEQTSAKLDRSLAEAYGFVDLMHQIADGRATIDSASISYSSVTPTETSKKKFPQTLKIKGSLDREILQDILKLFVVSEGYKELQPFYDLEKGNTFADIDKNMGHKNAVKHAQSYYANQLIDYLLRNVFYGLGELTGNKEMLDQERARLKTLYPDRQLCLFIGLLMKEAGLLPSSDDADESALIDLIKKKVASRLAQRAEVRGWIKRKKQQPK